MAQIPPPPAEAGTLSAPLGPIFSQARLDQMLAPIALYPDQLLSEVLMASTYPAEVIEAGRWIQQHRGFQSVALQQEVQAQPWDPSVKALCAFPVVLDRMSRDPGWTGQLGQAFTTQQQQVMDTVQSLRSRASAAGYLRSNAHEIVSSEGNYITVAPANQQVLYVPTYDPSVVYGPAAWPPQYPPYFPAYWGTDARFVDGFFWGAGITAGAGLLFGGFDWRHHAFHEREFDGRRFGEVRELRGLERGGPDRFGAHEIGHEFEHEERGTPIAHDFGHEVHEGPVAHDGMGHFAGGLHGGGGGFHGGGGEFHGGGGGHGGGHR